MIRNCIASWVIGSYVITDGFHHQNRLASDKTGRSLPHLLKWLQSQRSHSRVLCRIDAGLAMSPIFLDRVFSTILTGSFHAWSCKELLSAPSCTNVLRNVAASINGRVNWILTLRSRRRIIRQPYNGTWAALGQRRSPLTVKHLLCVLGLTLALAVPGQQVATSCGFDHSRPSPPKLRKAPPLPTLCRARDE